jgi:hypothetical protein
MSKLFPSWLHYSDLVTSILEMVTELPSYIHRLKVDVKYNMKGDCRKVSRGSYLASTNGAVNISETSQCNPFLQMCT